MHLILIVSVASVNCSTKRRVTLIAIEPTCVEIVNIKAYTSLFVDVCSKSCLKMVISICFITRTIIVKVCDRGFCIGEHKLFCRKQEEAIRFGKNELRAHHKILLTIVDAIDARRT